MLARPVESLPGPQALPGGCLYEPKWDGYRLVVHVTPAGVALQSRRGAEYTAAFPEIAAAAASQLPAGTVIDGELVVWNAAGARLDFPALQRRAMSSRRDALAPTASFLAFDLLALRGHDVRDRPLGERRQLLEDLAPALIPPLQISPATTDPAVAEQWRTDYAATDVGIEGLVVKGLGERYQPGRRGWLKLRTRSTAEVMVGAVTGSLARPDRLVLGLYHRGVFIIAGSTGPLRPAQAREVAPFLRSAGSEHPWPPELPTFRLGVWTPQRRLSVTLVEPGFVVEIAADSAFDRGHWRHVVRFMRARPDLDSADVAWPGRRSAT